MGLLAREFFIYLTQEKKEQKNLFLFLFVMIIW